MSSMVLILDGHPILGNSLDRPIQAAFEETAGMNTNGKRDILAGTEVLCHQCGKVGPLAIDCAGVLEPNLGSAGVQVFRLIDLSTLPCGHEDFHWMYEVKVSSLRKERV